jgi:phosphoribosylamine--glycine ligase
MDEVFYPALEGLSRVGSPYYGVLYAGLMIQKGNPYVLEFNARFGDPETQVVLPLLKTDLVDVLEAVIQHRLDQITLEWYEGASVCVVLTSEGYPNAYPTGLPISGLTEVKPEDPVIVFHAGTTWKDQHIVTSGGRVLGITGRGADFSSAKTQAYHIAGTIDFTGKHYRTDIASRAIPMG